ncbi:unnamed protein product [Cylicocyclus nassatus]|uniref:Complex 1 LYR protein domain-containing protein n=1 Tax=Cylicocyclus nassatus TaxID=53992 RepID=A0AA36H705_CYLNA|nr:unnamed protein product [Cylicocyclus nassatus]
MTAPIAKSVWVNLYKNLEREAAKFPQYNYRVFFQRRIREHFEANRGVSDPVAQRKLLEKGQKELEVIRRQVVISQLYPHNRTVIEEKLDTSHKNQSGKDLQ